MQWQAVELFSGVGNVSAVLRESGLSVASYDLKLGGDTMNFVKPAGFLLGPRYSIRNCVFLGLFLAGPKARDLHLHVPRTGIFLNGSTSCKETNRHACSSFW